MSADADAASGAAGAGVGAGVGAADSGFLRAFVVDMEGTRDQGLENKDGKGPRPSLLLQPLAPMRDSSTARVVHFPHGETPFAYPRYTGREILPA